MGGVAKVSLMIKKQGPLSKQKNDGIDMGMKIMGGMMDAGTDADAKRRKALVAPVAGLLKMGNGLKKDADLKGLEDDLAKAQQDLKDNVDAAKRKKKEAGQKAQEKIPGGGPELQGMANSVMGTFSAQAVRGFSTGNTVMNAIRDATRDTARNTARIANQDLRNGVGFA
jgi:hypothetical protein